MNFQMSTPLAFFIGVAVGVVLGHFVIKAVAK